MTARPSKRTEGPREDRRRLDERLDAALAQTFPASDPIAVGKATATEQPRRPIDRKSPIADFGRANGRATRKRRAIG